MYATEKQMTVSRSVNVAYWTLCLVVVAGAFFWLSVLVTGATLLFGSPERCSGGECWPVTAHECAAVALPLLGVALIGRSLVVSTKAPPPCRLQRLLVGLVPVLLCLGIWLWIIVTL